MNESPQKEPENALGLLDLAIVAAKYKATIIAVVLAAFLLGTFVSFLLPNVYTARARLLPPEQRQSASGVLLGHLSTLAGIGAGSFAVKNPNEIYVGMLSSRTVADKIIQRFDFQHIYEAESMEETRQQLARNTNIKAGKDGLITIEFDDENPQRAADVANAYVAELEQLTQSLAVTEAAQRRLFFERQLKQAKSDLAEAEVALKVTQERTGLIELDEQGKAIIAAVAAVRAQISAKEVELRALSTFATKTNSEYARVEQQLAGLRAELAKLQRQQNRSEDKILLSTSKVPEAGLEYVRRLRDVKYQEAIFDVLAKQYEAAKIDEAKESAVIQVLDSATVPDEKSKPFRGLIIAVATLIGALLALLVAVLRDALERAYGDPKQAARLAELRRYISFR